MIMTKTPLRISFVGGGTDLPCFYSKHGGAVISTTIDKYITVQVEPMKRGISVASYPEYHEVVYEVDKVSHEIVRECLCKVGIEGGVSMEIESDVGANGTGLGSSSALTVGLLNALYAYKGDPQLPETYAEMACEIEIERLGNPIGKQDQYAVTYGGMRHYKFHRDGSVYCSDWRNGSWPALEDRLMLFRTRIDRATDAATRSALFRNHDEYKVGLH